ncbi:MAG: KUP/HAK/KT family potassium transporter [Candidatus Falkowbacteria bacterium]|nr:KUP/HAK/KT family potassium transporter [Candidatus Falkowbacteria bacterium]
MDNKILSKKIISLSLLVGALGVVFGDIGTSPLYALKVTFFGLHPLARNPENVLGVLSLVFWALMIIVTIKYILLIMRADNKGEGGIFALLALLRQGRVRRIFGFSVTAVVLVGATLLYGDGVITPAISVLSAVEGFEILSSNLASYVVPLTILILIGLFYIQKKGTGRVGRLFGPVMVIWFIALIVLGLPAIIKYPQVLAAINPLAAYRFVCTHAWSTFFVLSSVALCITGCEALYADMGHFNRRVITWAWAGLVYPALIINYFGQGALLLSGSEIVGGNTFYALAPQWAFLGVVILATAATIIASQALISGVYSLTSQAVALGLFPKIKIVHTNPAIGGQIYIPFINSVLAVSCIALVLAFRTSGGLAAAYGLAVTGTMVITTLVFYALIRYLWKWPLWIVTPLISFLLIIDLAFFSGTLLKFWQGGFVPVIIAITLFIIMSTWDWGRALAHVAHLNLPGLSVGKFVELQTEYKDKLLNRSVVVMSSRPITSRHDCIPAAMDSFLSKWGLYIPKHIIFMNIVFLNSPRANRGSRYRIINFRPDITSGSLVSVQAFYGYMQTPNIRHVLTDLKEKGLIKIPSDPKKWLVLVARDNFVTRPRNILRRWRIVLLDAMLRYTKPITSYYGLGADNKVDIEIINI